MGEVARREKIGRREREEQERRREEKKLSIALAEEPREAIPVLLREIARRRPWHWKILWFFKTRILIEEESRWMLWVGRWKVVEVFYKENVHQIPMASGEDKDLRFPEVWVSHRSSFGLLAKTIFIKLKGCPVYFQET